MQQTDACAAAAAMVLVAAVLTGCSATDGLMSSVALPASGTTSATAATDDPHGSAAPRAPGFSGPQTSKLTVTGKQRGYLDALVGEGLRPSSELLALSIGSYVCQARAARQSDQAVWDFVYPLVSTDVHNAHRYQMDAKETDVDAATRSYIRIATERLC